MKYAAAPSEPASTSSIACPSGWPLGSRPSVSTVNEITAGNPAAPAARTMPRASSAYVMVMAVTRSAPASANVRICAPWYEAAASPLIVSPTT